MLTEKNKIQIAETSSLQHLQDKIDNIFQMKEPMFKEIYSQ